MDADLIERLAERCEGPVRYGDCARFAADYLHERTGDDLLGEWRDADRDAILERFGSIPRAVLSEMRRKPRWERVEPQEASCPAAGLALVDGRSWACCVALGDGWWAARFDGGLTMIYETDVRRAWVQRQARASSVSSRSPPGPA